MIPPAGSERAPPDLTMTSFNPTAPTTDASAAPATSRLVNMDFLRGFFVCLALLQHFTYYFNVWYKYYFNMREATLELYALHVPYLGKSLEMDDFVYVLALIFTPWVTQIYLAMAAFNLATRRGEAFAGVFPQKLRIYLLLLLFFTIENFIVAPDFGEAISFYPLQAWMVILSLLAVVYRYAGVHGILVLFVLSLVDLATPDTGLADTLEYLVQQEIHISYEYNARLGYFLTSGCMGLLLGYIHFQKPEWAARKDFITFAVGAALLVVWMLVGDAYHVNRFEIYETENLMVKTFANSLYVFGLELTVLAAFLYLERKGVRFGAGGLKFLKPFVWIGVHSLMVFALHRVIFVYLIMPVHVFISSVLEEPLYINSVYSLVYVALCALAGYFIQKTNFHNVVLR
jgi:hypothetical protein